MPYLQLVTNVKVPDAKAIAVEFSKVAAEVLGKPEKYISVSITYNETLTFAGSFDPAFQLLVISLGNINPQSNAVYSKKICEFLKDKFGIPDDRGYILFQDPGMQYLGYRSSTFSFA